MPNSVHGSGDRSALTQRPAAQQRRRTEPGHSAARSRTKTTAELHFRRRTVPLCSHDCCAARRFRDRECGDRRFGSADGDKVFEAFEGLRSDAFDEQQIFDAGERLLAAVADDRLGGDGSDSGQGLQSGGIGGVEIDLSGRPGCRAVRPG